MKQGVFFAFLLFAAACASSRPDVIQVGPWFPAKSAAEVQVFSSREQILKPWGAIAIIHSDKFHTGDEAAGSRLEKSARKLSAGMGADGVIIGEETIMAEPGLGVYQESETYISALAFKYAADISTAAK